jgi:hypothetical protein
MLTLKRRNCPSARCDAAAKAIVSDTDISQWSFGHGFMINWYLSL